MYYYKKTKKDLSRCLKIERFINKNWMTISKKETFNFFDKSKWMLNNIDDLMTILTVKRNEEEKKKEEEKVKNIK